MFVNQPFIWLINLYQLTLKPLVKASGSQCIYKESCSRYAERKLKEEIFLTAIPKIIWRILSCNPINYRLKVAKDN